MTPRWNPGVWVTRATLLLALACAGCAPQAVKEPERPAPPAADTKPADSKPAAKEPETAPPAPVMPALSPAEQELEKGVKNYEDGEYKVATKELQTALSLGLTARGDQAKAHKYLAFINCVSGRPNGCREEFRKAFVADPGFDLTPAEAGHPMWGPVFRSVKAAVAKPKPK
jgi:hypothetical protein